MNTSANAFDRNISNWKKEHATPWGRLRRRLAYANLSAHLPQGPLNILDAGGGDGLDSMPLAQSGHSVALVDYSAGMLHEARSNADAAGTSGHIHFHHAAVSEIPRLFPSPSYDVVLLHNVLSYVDDSEASLQAATTPLRPGGILSLMQVNRYSEALSAAVRQMDLDAAYEKLDAPTGHAVPFDSVPVQRYSAAELILLLKSQGFEMLRQYGILCVCNYIWDNEIKSDPEFFGKLERLEKAMSTRYPYYLQARFSHLVAIKNG